MQPLRVEIHVKTNIVAAISDFTEIQYGSIRCVKNSSHFSHGCIEWQLKMFCNLRKLSTLLRCNSAGSVTTCSAVSRRRRLSALVAADMVMGGSVVFQSWKIG